MTKKTYRVHPGIDWVNGSRVPESRKVSLTDTEARFDLDHGRIELLTVKSRSNSDTKGDGDGGN